MTVHVVGVGNPVFDYIKTPWVSTKSRILSGCSTNACLAARRLGAETTLIGCVGDDFRETLLNTLAREGINNCLYPSQETGGFSLTYDVSGNRVLDVLGRADPIPDVPMEVITEADAVIIGPILGEVSRSLIVRISALAKGIVLLDPQGLLRYINNDGSIEHYRNGALESIIPLCDIVKANEVEARIITGIDPRLSEDSLRRATEALFRLGCRIAIVTLAADGSAAYDGHDFVRVPAYTTHAIDPTGAGDTYAAGFAVKYIRTGSLKEACYYGSAVASIMVENVGPDFPLTLEEAERRLQVLFRGEK